MTKKLQIRNSTADFLVFTKSYYYCPSPMGK